MIERSYLHKIKDIGIDAGTFKNDKGEDVAYRSLVMEIVIDGSVEKINLSGASAPKPALLEPLLKSAQDSSEIKNFLED